MYVTIIIVLSAVFMVILLWTLSIKDPYFPINPYWDYDYNYTKISRLEMENAQLRNDLFRYKYNYNHRYIHELNLLRYENELRFRSFSEQEKMAKKLKEAMKPLEKLKEEITPNTP